MNQVSSAPGASLIPDSTDWFTTANLVIVALFALLAIAGIVWGARAKHRRKQARREVKEWNATIADAPAPAPATAPAGATSASGASHRSNAGPDSAPGAADGPVTQLKGLGPKLADRLAALGITTVGQIAALTDDDAAALDAQLGPFTGRMASDRWLEQARFLAAGDVKGFEAVFGRL